MTLDEAIAFARKHGMKVEEQDMSHLLRVTYPSGEYQDLSPMSADTPGVIVNMTCNLL